uniref:Uncharacterized protein n=1 Tax=Megaselia scalaris TaxID=36166 RepID=T1GRN6_MEGSC
MVPDEDLSALAASVQKEKEGQEDEVKQEHLVDNDDKEPVPSEPPQEQSTPVPIIVKRGRGRPRKYPRNRNVIHPVKLAKVMKSEGSSMEDGEAKESNHLNKTEPQVILTEKNSDGSSLNKTDPGPAKRGRGRPRKDQSLNSLTPRKPSYSLQMISKKTEKTYINFLDRVPIYQSPRLDYGVDPEK